MVKFEVRRGVVAESALESARRGKQLLLRVFAEVVFEGLTGCRGSDLGDPLTVAADKVEAEGSHHEEVFRPKHNVAAVLIQSVHTPYRHQLVPLHLEQSQTAHRMSRLGSN